MAHSAVGDQDELAYAAAKINSNLSWSQSVEGPEFWLDVFDRLNTYAGGGTPRKLGTRPVEAKEPTFAEQAQQRISAIKKGTAAAPDAAQTEN